MSIKENNKLILVVVIILVLVTNVLIGTYKFKRWWNYNMGYKSAVSETSRDLICEMVKPEAIINPDRCQ